MCLEKKVQKCISGILYYLDCLKEPLGLNEEQIEPIYDEQIEIIIDHEPKKIINIKEDNGNDDIIWDIIAMEEGVLA